MPLTAELFPLIEAGHLEAVTSSLVLVEILTRPKQLGHQVAVDSYKIGLATFPHLELRRCDIVIAEHAADLRARYRLAVPKAIQVATAVVEGAQAFVGNSPRLSVVRELEIILLHDLQRGASIPIAHRA